MTLSLDFSKLRPLITDNCLILTPNARTQQAIYAGQAIELNSGDVIAPNKICSFSQWQNELWSELSFIKTLPTVISKTVLKIWLEKIIANETDWDLTNEAGVANKVVEAFQNSVAWELSLDDIQMLSQNKSLQSHTDDELDISAESSLEVSYFIKWIAQYKIIAESKHIICSFEVLKMLLEYLGLLFQKTQKMGLPENILLVGFNQFTPLEKSFFNQLKSLGLQIDSYNYKKSCKKSNVIEFDSFTDEIDFAAAAAKQIVEKDQKVNVAIVVNQLSDNLTDVYSAFSQAFQPEENKPWITLSKPLYNVSAGFSIAEHSIVKAANLLLNLRKDRITLEEMLFIKNTEFYQWGNERSNTKYFLHKLCLKGRKEYKVKFILAEIEKFENEGAVIANAGLAKVGLTKTGLNELGSDQIRLTKLKSRLTKLESKQAQLDSIKNYQNAWLKTLIAWGWGIESDDYVVSLTEHKVCHEYLKLINKMFELDNLLDKVSEKVALQYLNQLATQKSFQLPSDRSQVHVLGVLEATGLQFEHLILVGFNSVKWPVNNKPNPFLPVKIQREYKMPGGSAEREYEYTKSLSDSLISSSDELIVTSSNENSDSKSSVSVFFTNLKSGKDSFISQLLEKSRVNKSLGVISNYHWISDPYLQVDKEKLHGGTGFLSRYASCPFSSILAYYLKVTNFEVAESGIDARQRGVWLHDTMQLIWEQLNNQQTLIELDDGHLVALIEEKLESKLKEIKSILLLNASESIIALEKDKLASLIKEWLLIEKERDPFSIKALEKEVMINLQGIDFTFRLDRVDSTDNGLIEIIDYKTGKVQVNDWFSARPTEAQMPAYMLAFGDEKISAIDYARIKKGEVAQVGLCFDVPVLNSKPTEGLSAVKKEAIMKFKKLLDDGGEVESKHSELKEKPLNNNDLFDREELKSQWQQTLDRIAYGMSQGFAPVSPKDINQSCTYCDYRSICRIDERQPDSNHQTQIDSVDLNQRLSS